MMHGQLLLSPELSSSMVHCRHSEGTNSRCSRFRFRETSRRCTRGAGTTQSACGERPTRCVRWRLPGPASGPRLSRRSTCRCTPPAITTDTSAATLQECVCTLGESSGSSEAVWALALSKDSAVLFSASGDSTIKCWRVRQVRGVSAMDRLPPACFRASACGGHMASVA